MFEFNFFKATFIVVIISTLLVLMSYFANISTIRNFWNFFSGTETSWNEYSLQITEEFFWFPGSDNSLLMIGHFGDEQTIFPDRSIITATLDSNKDNELYEKLGKICSIGPEKCTAYNEFVFSSGTREARCIKLGRQLPWWEMTDLHYYCDIGENGLVIEYHGDYDDFPAFERQYFILVEQLLAQRGDRVE